MRRVLPAASKSIELKCVVWRIEPSGRTIRQSTSGRIAVVDGLLGGGLGARAIIGMNAREERLHRRSDAAGLAGRGFDTSSSDQVTRPLPRSHPVQVPRSRRCARLHAAAPRARRARRLRCPRDARLPAVNSARVRATSRTSRFNASRSWLSSWSLGTRTVYQRLMYGARSSSAT